MYTFDNRGQGPNEYVNPTDFYIKDDHELIVSVSFHILTYNPVEKSLLHSIETDSYSGFLLKKDNDLYYYNKGNTIVYGEDRTLGSVLFRIGPDGTRTALYSPTSDEQIRMLHTTIFHPLTLVDDQVYFRYPRSSTIFEINDNVLSPAYEIDFGDKKYPDDLFAGVQDLDDIYNRIEENKGVNNIWAFHATKQYLYIGFSDYQYNGYVSFHDPKTGNTKTGHIIVDDMFFLGNQLVLKQWPLPGGLDGDELLYHLEPQVLLDGYKRYKNAVSDPTVWNAFVSNHAELVSLCENMKEDDNPILLKIKIKL